MSVSAIATPILIPWSGVYQSPLGYGVDALTGSLTTYSITWAGAPLPTTNPGGIDNTYAKFSVVSSQQTFVSSLSAGATISGSYGPVSGSLNATFSENLQSNTSSVVLFAICDAINGVYSILSSGFESNFAQTGDDSIQSAVSYITENGYQEFVNHYGTHFVSGVYWGMQYRGSYSATFSDSQTAQEFAANINASYNGAVTSAKLVASFASTASSSTGYAGESGYQDGVGFSVVAGPASADTISKSLDQWNQEVTGGGQQLMYSCADWRMIPAIADAANQNPGSPEVDWSDFSTNLPLAAQCWAALQYNYVSAQNSNAIGLTYQNILVWLKGNLQQSMDQLTSSSVSDICNWNSSDYSTQVADLQTIQNIANGMFAYTVTVTVDKSYSSPTGSSDQQGPWTMAPLDSNIYGINCVKNGVTTCWGGQWVSPGVLKACLNDGELRTQSLTWEASQTSVKVESPSYSWLTCTVTVC